MARGAAAAHGDGARELSLLREMAHAKVVPNVISYSAGISACEKGGQRPEVLSLLRKMEHAKVGLDVMS